MASGRAFTKGCVLALAVWLLLAGAYYYVAWTRIHDRIAAAVVGLLGGTFASLLVSSIAGFFTGGRDRAAVRRAMDAEPWQDGRLEAASGVIQPIGEPLRAPFTGVPCVAYQYDIKPTSKGTSDYAGFAMTPCAIQTLRGPARVLGFAMLDAFPAAPEHDIDRNRAVEYLSSANVETVGLPSLVRVFNELVSDDDGTVRKDYRIGGDGVTLQGRRIDQRSIPVGAVVTLLGQWSEARGGFAHSGAAAMLRIFPGDLEVARRQSGGDAKSSFLVALLFFGALHAILVPAYYFSDKARLGRQGAESVWDERDCDSQKAKLDGGANPNEVGSDAMTPLMNAARMNEPACVSNLIAAGARLEDRDKDGDTALVHAVRAGQDENARVLLAAGAKEFRVTSANGRPIADGDGPLQAVTDYIAAVHRGDFPMIARLMAHVTVERLEERRDDLPFWRSRFPQTFTVESGWMTDRAATLTIRGTASSGPQRIVFHVERRPDTTAQAEADSSRRTPAGAQPEFWQIRYEWRPDER